MMKIMTGWVLCLVMGTAVAESPPVLQPVPPIDETISLDFLMGKFNPAKQPGFAKIPKRYASRKGLYMQAKALEAYRAMYDAAKREGIKLVIKSAARNFNYQKGIWEGKWTGKRRVGDFRNISKAIKDPTSRAFKILEYSSMPGSSRHHWGTDIDLNSFDNNYFKSGKGLRVYNWLRTHAADYGFCQPYSAKNERRPNGYNEERWHWSYKPLSAHLTMQAALRLQDEHIYGFKGAEVAPDVQVVRHYVLGIDYECR